MEEERKGRLEFAPVTQIPSRCWIWQMFRDHALYIRVVSSQCQYGNEWLVSILPTNRSPKVTPEMRCFTSFFLQGQALRWRKSQLRHIPISHGHLAKEREGGTRALHFCRVLSICQSVNLSHSQTKQPWRVQSIYESTT
ncbi:hypothetical protein BofuT4_P000610.1 [Botrytis cinerea T4]|uniref:Uncharacterized protein n=1 Tax=Botryotinia fuckeliana (strain T4) TaxID=999810 RepID=G2YLW6_BOTF4|nr:hypothetical protein BofuT4_P000610.1 [Botrytis cinerea T4]